MLFYKTKEIEGETELGGFYLPEKEKNQVFPFAAVVKTTM